MCESLKINIHFMGVHACTQTQPHSRTCIVYTGTCRRRQSQPLQVCGFQQLQGDVLLLRFSIPRRLSKLCAQCSVPGISQNVCKPLQLSEMHSIQGKTQHQLAAREYFITYFLRSFCSLVLGSIDEKVNWQG